MTRSRSPDPAFEMLALIREAECIGCTKCIQACPYDAILGSAKHLHTVIGSECTGCERCVPACPVDCIDMIIQPETIPQEKKDRAQTRFIAHHQRLSHKRTPQSPLPQDDSFIRRKHYIQDAIARVKTKKSARDAQNTTKIT